MASGGNIWWVSPLQAFVGVAAAANFGASALQSPLTMPVLQLPSVPAKYAGEQLKYLLHRSEFFFPPLNAVCTVGNLVAAVACYLHRGTSRFAAAKLPYAAAAFALCAATTAYALGIMVPINRRLGALATNLKTNDADEESEKELRALQQKWRKLNYGRASLMLGSSIAAVYGFALDGSMLRV